MCLDFQSSNYEMIELDGLWGGDRRKRTEAAVTKAKSREMCLYSMKRSGRNNIMDAIESGINSLFYSGRFIVFRQFCQIISVVD